MGKQEIAEQCGNDILSLLVYVCNKQKRNRIRHRREREKERANQQKKKKKKEKGQTPYNNFVSSLLFVAVPPPEGCRVTDYQR